VDPDLLRELAGSRGRRPLPPLSSALLVVVDLQRFFTEPGAPRWLPDWPDRMPGVRALIAAFQSRSLPVIATCHGHPPGDSGGTMRFFFERLLTADDPFADLDPKAGLPPSVPVFRKQRYPVFSVPAIEEAARRWGTVVLVGVQTHRCILASAMDAARLEIRPVVVADACAAGRVEDHRAALRVLAQGHAHVATVEEVIRALERGRPCGDSLPGPPPEVSRTLEDRDLLVVGGGPAGISCAVQARRDGWSVVVVGDQPPGGLLPAARRIDNLPGCPEGISGRELARRLARHLSRSGASFREGRVTLLERDARGRWIAGCADGTAIRSRAVCLATGTRPVPLPWREDPAHPVARDPRTWPDRMPGERVVVLGGGEAALDGALNALDRGARPLVLARGPVRGSPALLREVEGRGIEVRTGVEVTDLLRLPDGRWEVLTKEGRREVADRVVACIGREPEADLLQGLDADPGDPGIIAAPAAGLWLAGDVLHGRDRYVATALGDGQRAAVLAGEWLRTRQGIPDAQEGT